MEAGIFSMPHLKLFGLPSLTRKKFNHALRLSGQGSQSRWLLTKVNRFISEQERKYGDLLLALTAEEKWIVEVVDSGAAEPAQIAEETGFPLDMIERVLADLVERSVLEIRRQGGKTDQTRGARRPLYFVSEKYKSRSE